MGGRARVAAGLLLSALSLTACNESTVAAPATPTAQPSPSASASPTAAPTSSPRPVASRRPFTLALAGDVHFEGSVRRRLLRDPRTAFGEAASVLRRADLAVANLETAVTDRGTPVAGKEYVFRAPATAFTALRSAGIDVVTNANNHGMDYGLVGLQDTLAAARAARFPVVGSGVDEDAAFSPYRRTVRGWRVAVLGATQVLDTAVAQEWTARGSKPGLASAYRVERLVRAVREARRTADVVVVYLHWGVEREECPSAAQRELAKRLTDAGAAVVVGSHAHVVQGAGMLGRSYVHYGLGNFLFYASGSGLNTLTSVVTLTLDGGRVVAAKASPVRIGGGTTTLMRGDARSRELAREASLRGCTGLRAP